MTRTFSYVAIPTVDFERALAFFAAITDGRVRRHPGVSFPMAYLTDDADGDVGHLFALPGFFPSDQGPIVYLELAPDLDETLAKIVAAGGTVLMPKTAIGPGRGYWALFRDTEGNRLALHSTR